MQRNIQWKLSIFVENLVFLKRGFLTEACKYSVDVFGFFFIYFNCFLFDLLIFFSVFFVCNVFRCFRVILSTPCLYVNGIISFSCDGIVIFKIIIFTIQTVSRVYNI